MRYFRKTLLGLLIAINGGLCLAQTDNTFYAKGFPGTDVGTKVSNAMNACSPNTAIPCIIIIDPSLAGYPAGTMPQLCTQCSLGDYRNGFPSGGGGVATQQQISPYLDQSTPISSVTDANAKTTLTKVNAALLGFQQALQQAGIFISNTLAAQIQGASGAAFFLMNPTQSATGPATVTDSLGTGLTLVQTVGGASGAPNFNPGGKDGFQAGYVINGGCGTGPNGKVLSSDFDTASHCGYTVTSTSQITSAAASLSTFTWPAYKTASASSLTGFNQDFTAIYRGSLLDQWTSAGGYTGPAFTSTTSYGFFKSGEYWIGPSGCAVGSTSNVATFTTTGTFGLGANLTPFGEWQVVLVYDHIAGTFNCYLNDGIGAYAKIGVTGSIGSTSGTPFQTATGSTVKNALFAFIPGVKLTQGQIAGIYCGFSATASCGSWNMAANQGPTFLSSSSTQWQTHVITPGDGYTHDCQPVNLATPGAQYTNGGQIGTNSYWGSWSFCHIVVSTAAPTFAATMTTGIPSTGPGSTSVSLRVDGTLQQTCGPPFATGNWSCEVALPNDGSNHIVDANIGVATTNFLNTATGYANAQQYSGVAGFFFYSFGVPKGYSFSTVTPSGKTTVCFTDSIVCSGNVAVRSSESTFAAMQRYGGATNTFGDANFAVIGLGSILKSNFWNPTQQTNLGGTFPDSTGTAFYTAYVTPLANGIPSNLGHFVDFTGINDIAKMCHNVLTSSANGLGIFAYALWNEAETIHAQAPSSTFYQFSPLNDGNLAETATDGCTGNSYTMFTTQTVPEWNGSAWAGVSVTAGTVFTGAAQNWQYRAVEADICAHTGHCVYKELGPGAAVSTNGYKVPSLDTTNTSCFISSAQTCLFTDNLHLTAWGHFNLCRYVNDVMGGSLTCKQAD